MQCNYKHSIKLYDWGYLHLPYKLYQGRHTMRWVFAASLLWLTEWNFLRLELLSGVFCVGTVAARTAFLFPGGCRTSSLCKAGDVLKLLGFRALDLVVFLSSGPAADGRSLCASSCVSDWHRPLSMVLKASSRPRERQSLLESWDNVQRSLPFKLSAISRYWLTFAKQVRKPVW